MGESRHSFEFGYSQSVSVFDDFIGIDWSGAKAPQKTFGIALATCKAKDQAAPTALTEKLSRTDVFKHLLAKAESGKRCLVGIDCNFGYAHAVGIQQFGQLPLYKTLWKTVDDLNRQHSNFFAGDFWTNPAFSDYFWTKGKQPTWFDIKKLRRVTETLAAEQALGIPESPFKLIGAKQVGKGGLAGMRFLHNLKEVLGDRLAIWPFEAQKVARAKMVITEIYPRLFIRHAAFGNKKVRTLQDLNAILRHFECGTSALEHTLNDHLSDAIIASAGLKYFHQHYESLDASKLPDEAHEFEGWIFGVKEPEAIT